MSDSVASSTSRRSFRTSHGHAGAGGVRRQARNVRLWLAGSPIWTRGRSRVKFPTCLHPGP
jgi:hypothetical protein